MTTSHDICRALFVDKKPLRVGLREVKIWPETIDAWVEQGYPTEEVAQPDGTVLRQPVDWVTHFGFDTFRAGSAVVINTSPLLNYNEVLAESDEWVITRDGSGAAYKSWKNRSGTHEHIDFRMTSREIWERDYRPPLLEVNRARLDIEGTRAGLAERRRQGLWAYYQADLLWQHMCDSVGMLTFLEQLVLDPAWIHDYNRVHIDFYKAHWKILFAEAGLPDGVRLIDDFSYTKGLMSSPRLMRELYLPYYKELVDFLHSYGLVVQLHSCGGVTEAVPLLLEAGFDVLDPLEVKAGVDPLALSAHYGDKLALVGGMDIRVLETGDKETIKREVVRLVRGVIERGGRYVFGSDHSVPPTVRYDDYCYACAVCREHGWY